MLPVDASRMLTWVQDISVSAFLGCTYAVIDHAKMGPTRLSIDAHDSCTCWLEATLFRRGGPDGTCDRGNTHTTTDAVEIGIKEVGAGGISLAACEWEKLRPSGI